MRRGAFCQFSVWWIYYYGSNKFTELETGKSYLCAMYTCIYYHQYISSLKFAKKNEFLPKAMTFQTSVHDSKMAAEWRP